MWIIAIIIIILIIAVYSTFSKGIDKTMDNTINNFEQDKWWTIGMLADMHNKRNDKNK